VPLRAAAESLRTTATGPLRAATGPLRTAAVPLRTAAVPLRAEGEARRSAAVLDRRLRDRTGVRAERRRTVGAGRLNKSRRAGLLGNAAG
jgi:hypothetical protein